jgi:hypothetical protein
MTPSAGARSGAADALAAGLDERGWAVARALLPAGSVRVLAGWARRLAAPDAAPDAAPARAGGRDFDTFLGAEVSSPIQDRHGLAADDPAFAAVAADAGLAALAARALGVAPGGVRLLADTLVVGRRRRPDQDAAALHDVHQGDPFLPVDRSALTVRIALDEIGPGHRQLRFFEGSHRLGPFPRRSSPTGWADWPELSGRSLSPLVHLAPGDATLHRSSVVRGYTVNVLPDEPRSYVVTLVDADARYTGLASPLTDGLGLRVGAPLDHPAFPLLPG